LNLWLRGRYGIEPIPASKLIFSALAVILLGQIVALRPALPAAHVPPSEALRSI
jgi:hypothetical protein